MRIYMIGAGAMGGVFGGLLHRAGADVTLIDPRVEHIEKIRSEGLQIEGVRGRHLVRIPAQATGAGLPKCELAVIFTDANTTRDAARAAQELLSSGGFALTLQNGIGNVETLVAELGAAQVIAGVSMNSAANPAPGRVAYTNSGMTSLGELDGRDSARVHEVVELFNRAEIPTEIVADPMAWVWSKFVHNCSVNALAAISGLRGGEIYRNPAMSGLQDRVMDEIMAVVAKKGIKLPDADPRKKIKEHCRKRYNKPSMMQHIEQGRRTEIDALNGALVCEARALGIPVPFNEAVVALVKGLEQSRRQMLHEPPRDYKKLEEAAERGEV
ncbi:MAG: ketopantoate reductase family protein [Burkholderiales bacterium]